MTRIRKRSSLYPKWVETARLEFRLLPQVILASIVVAFAVTSWLSSLSIGTHWDESVDLQIARALLEDPLRGTPLDPSQGRLPMYVTALALSVARPTDYQSTLSVSRSLSIAAGSVAILLTFVLAGRWFGMPTALLSAAILAASPYFLSFSRLAMTEGDAFCAAGVLLVLLAFDRYRWRRDSPSIVLLALAFGIALASKFLLVCLFAPLILCDLSTDACPVESTVSRPGRATTSETLWSVISWSAAATFLVISPMAASWPSASDLRRETFPAVSQGVFVGSVAFWAGALAIGLVLIHDSFRRRPGSQFILKAGGHWPPWARWPTIVLLSGVFCLVLFPEHMFNSRIMATFFGRLSHWDGQQPLSGFVPSARLYAGVVLFKIGLPLGVLSVSALVWAALRMRREFAPRVILCVTAVYAAVLAALPLWQTFYLMSIYPMLVIVLSAFLVDVAAALPRGATRTAWVIVVTGAIGWMLLGDIRVYPAFGYYGYETLGPRWMGSDTRGYRNIVHVTNDGTEEALRWCDEHVPKGCRVFMFTTDLHVAQAFAAQTRPRYEFILQHMVPGMDPELPRELLDAADYVVSHHTRMLRYFETPPESGELGQFRVVHTVCRGRGTYRMPVVTIYRRSIAARTTTGDSLARK